METPFLPIDFGSGQQPYDETHQLLLGHLSHSTHQAGTQRLQALELISYGIFFFTSST